MGAPCGTCALTLLPLASTATERSMDSGGYVWVEIGLVLVVDCAFCLDL